MKPGRKTTEFWSMISVNVIAILTLFGIIDPDSGATVQTAVTETIENVAALITMGLTVYGYARSRGTAKAPVATIVSPSPVATSSVSTTKVATTERI